MFIVDSRKAALFPTRQKAIVTILMGDDYIDVWETLSRRSWEDYAERHGYDLIVITTHLDDSEFGRARPIPWQKLLILDQPWSAAYERIVWLDADIVISRTAPDVISTVRQPECVGAVNGGDQFSPAEKHVLFELQHNMQVDPSKVATALNYDLENGYAIDGLEVRGRPMLNTGVLVLSPRHHNELLLRVYPNENRSRLYEQSYLSLAILESRKVELLSARFNWTVHHRLVLDFYGDGRTGPEQKRRILLHLQTELRRKAYFLHFAGAFPLLKQIAELKKALVDVLEVG